MIERIHRLANSSPQWWISTFPNSTELRFLICHPITHFCLDYLVSIGLNFFFLNLWNGHTKLSTTWTNTQHRNTNRTIEKLMAIQTWDLNLRLMWTSFDNGSVTLFKKSEPPAPIKSESNIKLRWIFNSVLEITINLNLVE